MKTGRLLKFQRPGGEVQAYLYRNGDACHAALYVLAGGRLEGGHPVHDISAATDAEVERAVREWVDRCYPKAR